MGGCPAVLEVWVAGWVVVRLCWRCGWLAGWLSVGGSDSCQSWSCVFVGFTDVYEASPFLIVAGL